MKVPRSQIQDQEYLHSQIQNQEFENSRGNVVDLSRYRRQLSDCKKSESFNSEGLVVSWIQKHLRNSSKFSPALLEANRICRSLSFVLGEKVHPSPHQIQLNELNEIVKAACSNESIAASLESFYTNEKNFFDSNVKNCNTNYNGTESKYGDQCRVESYQSSQSLNASRGSYLNDDQSNIDDESFQRMEQSYRSENSREETTKPLHLKPPLPRLKRSQTEDDDGISPGPSLPFLRTHTSPNLQWREEFCFA